MYICIQETTIGLSVDSKPAIKPRHCNISTNDTPEPPGSPRPAIKPRNFSTPPGTCTQDPFPRHDSPLPAVVSKPTESTLGEALQSGNYQISWTKCANLPAPMYGASVAVDDHNIYVAAGCAPDDNTYQQIFCYKIANNRWSQFPSPGHNLGILCMVDGKLNVFGGHDAVNEAATNRVSTFNQSTNTWMSYFPNMINARKKPGVVVHLEYIIVAGGAKDETNFRDDIEMLNWQLPHLEWQRVDISLPVPMWAISLTVSSDKFMIVGYTQAKGRSTSVYQIPVMSLTEEPHYTNELESGDTWVKLCSAPYHDTALVPYSNPPVIVGGNFRGNPKSDISIYSTSENCWRNCASLSSPRINVAVATIYGDIIVIGGNAKGTSVDVAMDSTLTTVEMGKLKKLKKADTVPKARVEYDYSVMNF